MHVTGKGLYIHCVNCGALNMKRRRVIEGGATPTYRCGYCHARFNEFRVIPEEPRVEHVHGEDNRFRVTWS